MTTATKKHVATTQNIDAALDALLANTKPLTDADVAELAAAGQELDRDPAFIADYLKGAFVENVYCALEENHMSQSELAKALGKTRQYLSKIMNQQKLANFTIDTMAEISAKLNRRLVLLVLAEDETASVLRHVVKRTTFQPMASARKAEAIPFVPALRNDFFANERTAMSERDTAYECASMPA